MTRRAVRIAYMAGVVFFAAATLGASSLPAAPAAAAALGAPHMVEQATAAGIDHRYDGEFTYFVGGGVAVLDCNTDGRPDLYFAGGADLPPCIETPARRAVSSPLRPCLRP